MEYNTMKVPAIATRELPETTQELQNLTDVFTLSDGVMQIFKRENEKLPYHINFLDIIWANENAHSRILNELLKQSHMGKFEVLESFLATFINIGSTTEFKPINPKVTSESERIDILITDENYAIIIENKIHGAVDQDSQIARYIQQVLRKGYEYKEIFIIYLTRDGNKQISVKSWVNRANADFEKHFENNYYPLSFQNDILPWLKEFILPNCRNKDVYLKSTVEQYIDYLEGMFNIRQINNKMNTEIEKHIIKQLELVEKIEEDLPTVKSKIDELTKTRDRLEEMRKKMETQFFEGCLARIKNDFPNQELIDQSGDRQFPKVGILFREGKFSIIIESDGTRIYYAIGNQFASSNKIPEVANKLQTVLQGYPVNNHWYGYKYSTYREVYESFKSLTNEVLKMKK